MTIHPQGLSGDQPSTFARTPFGHRVVERTAAWALRAFGFTSRWVTTAQGPVHTLVRPGSPAGPRLVLLHGIVASGADYFPLLWRLARTGLTLVAPDLPGHGLSPAPAAGMQHDVLLAALTEALDGVLDGPAVLFGNSMGGFAAVRVAGARPDLVAGLVLVSPGGAPPPDELAFQAFLRRFHIRGARDARRFVENMAGGPLWWPRLLAWGVQERFGRPEIRELLSHVDAGDMLTGAEVGRLTAPTLVLWGGRDAILPVAQREFFRTHLPDHAVFEEPAHLGHAPFLDDPDYLVRRMLRFVDAPYGSPDTIRST